VAKPFFYVCAGILMLAISYHLGARSATAQAPANPVVAAGLDAVFVYTSNGDVYYTPDGGFTWQRRSNVFAGPTPAKPDTWGSVKARYLTPGTGASEQRGGRSGP